jgi:Family of unknown function (DUF6790)
LAGRFRRALAAARLRRDDGMIGQTIAFVLGNLPAFLLVAALVAAALAKTPAAAPERYLAWLLLLRVGGSGLWAALFHLAFPAFAAAQDIVLPVLTIALLLAAQRSKRARALRTR